MSIKARVAVLVLVLTLAACGSTGSGETETTNADTSSPDTSGLETNTTAATSGDATETTTSAGQVDGEVVFTYIGDQITLGDFPTLMAIELLRERGIDVEVMFVAEDSLSVQAVVDGTATFGNTTPLQAIFIHESAPDIVTFLQPKRQGWVLASSPEIQTLEDLEGKSLAVHDPTSFTNTVAELTIENNDLENVEIVIIPGSEVRAQALISGQIDATVLDTQDVAFIQAETPDSVRVLHSFAEDYPDLTSLSWIVSSSWIDENRDLAVEVAKAMIEANRAVVEDVDAAIADAQSREEYDDIDDSVIAETIRLNVEQNLVTLNGHVTEESARAEMQFYFDNGQSEIDPEGLDLSERYAFDVIDEAVEQLGGPVEG